MAEIESLNVSSWGGDAEPQAAKIARLKSPSLS